MAKDEAGALARFGMTDREIEQALGRVKVRQLIMPIYILNIVSRNRSPWKRGSSSVQQRVWGKVSA